MRTLSKLGPCGGRKMCESNSSHSWTATSLKSAHVATITTVSANASLQDTLAMPAGVIHRRDIGHSPTINKFIFIQAPPSISGIQNGSFIMSLFLQRRNIYASVQQLSLS